MCPDTVTAAGMHGLDVQNVMQYNEALGLKVFDNSVLINFAKLVKKLKKALDWKYRTMETVSN